MKLYTTSSSILTLVTWIPQNMQGKLHPSLRGWLWYRRIGRGSSTSHSGGAPQPLCSAGNHSTKVNLVWPCRVFFYCYPWGQQLKARLCSFELSYRTVVLQSFSSFLSTGSFAHFWRPPHPLQKCAKLVLHTFEEVAGPTRISCETSFAGQIWECQYWNRDTSKMI